MYFRLYILIFSVVISVGIRSSLAEESKTASSAGGGGNRGAGWSGSAGSSQKDDLYIDDDDLEGSGANPEVKYDLESSGSGFGPDDEDAEVDRKPALPAPKSKQEPKRPPPPVKEEEDEDDVHARSEIKPDRGGGSHFDRGSSETNTNDITNLNTNQKTKHDDTDDDSNRHDKGVYMVDAKHDERGATSFFAQPGTLAAMIGGVVVGLLCAILVVMFIVYRMRKKDEGSYPLDEPKRSPTSNPYMKSSNREFYA